MASRRKINVALVGLGFGAEFIPIYQRHPQARVHAICQRSQSKLDAIGDAFGIERRYDDYKALLMDPEVDAVHINTGIPDHAWMTLAALKAGKHVACTVPMATSLEDCKKIVDAVKKSKLRYMMMETVVYAREYLFIKELLDKGKLGKLQFLQASHQQDMDGWPHYWPGLPPMWYATHCVGPVLGLAGQPAEYVSCWIGHDSSGAGQAPQFAFCGGNGAHQNCQLGFDGAHHPLAFRHGAAISREHRRLRHQKVVRVDIDRASKACPAHGEEGGVRDPGADRSA